MSKATVLIRAKRKVETSCPADCEKCTITKACATYRGYGLRYLTEESIRRDYLEQKTREKKVTAFRTQVFEIHSKPITEAEL